MGYSYKDFPDACLILNAENQLVGINPAGEKLLNLKRADILGKPVQAVLSNLSISPDFNGWDETKLIPGNKRNYFATSLLSLFDDDGNFIGRVAILRDLDMADQNDSLRNQNAILTALQETTIELHSSLELKDVLRHIVERACNLLETTHGYLDILRETGELEPVVGIGALEVSLNYKVVRGQGLAGTVWLNGKTLVINNYDQWPGRIEQFPHDAIHAIVGIPLLLKEQVIGVIGVAHGAGSDTKISENDVLILERFADLAVVALENARIYERAQKEIEFRRETEIQLRNANQVLKLQIERIELLQRDLQELAIRDPLTVLYNRRYLTDALERVLKDTGRLNKTMAILMMDSDHLKGINDKYGHKAGDNFLVQISDVIKDNIRAGDIACRYGGDEFVLVMSNLTIKSAYKRAEALRKAVADKSLVYRNENVNISVSIGIAVYPEHGRSGDALLQFADQALYEAKRLGKNRVVVFNEELKDGN